MSPPTPDHHHHHHHHRSPSAVTMAFLGRSVLSFRRNQVASADQFPEDDLPDLDLFHSFVADRLLSLAASDPVLSFPFLHSVLDVFVSCEREFKNLLVSNPAALVAKPPADLLDRALKSLDLLTSVRHSLRCLRHWNRSADIAASAIPARPTEAHLRRARRALDGLLASAEPNPERARSFRCPAAPRAGDGGFASAAYAMSSVLALATWAVVAAFPSGSASAVPTVQPPKQLAWAGAMAGLQERVAEEWRRRGRLAEAMAVERCGKELMDLIEGGGAEEIAEKAGELAAASRALEEGMEPFERRVREVFRRVVDSRAEVMKLMEQSSRSATPFIVL